MSAVKPATDKEIDDLIRTCRLNAAPDTIWGRVLQEGALKLAARIAADAARIRELEAAGRALLTCPAIADIASEDRDPEDVVAERKMRAALGSRRDG